MKDLIERLEKATGPDRGIDVAIWELVVMDPKEYRRTPPNRPRYSDWERCHDGEWREFYPNLNAKDYTGSIDAALTLMPEFVNRRWYIADSDDRSNGNAVATVYHPADILSGRIPRYEGASPAIAICIAILKAREARS